MLIFTGANTALFMLIQNLQANFYDLRSAKDKKIFEVHPHSKKNRYQPLITVILYVYNHQDKVSDSINSIVKNRYQHIQLIVINDASNDNSKPILSKIKRQNAAIKVINKRRHLGKRQAYLDVRSFIKGEIVYLLDASYIIDNKGFKTTAQYFNHNSDLIGIKPELAIKATQSLSDILQSYTFYMTNHIHKSSSLSHYTDDQPFVIKKSHIRELLSDYDLNMKYGAGVTLYKTSTASLWQLSRHMMSYHLTDFKRLLKRSYELKMPIRKYGRLLSNINKLIYSILLPAVLGYICYLSVRLGQPLLYLTGLLILILYLSSITINSNISVKEKVKSLVLMPAVYPFAVALILIKPIIILRSLISRA